MISDATTALGDAQLHLSRGDFATAGALLLGIARDATGQQAMQVAELLLAARLLDEATDVAARIAREQGDVWPWINQFAGHMRARGLIEASRRVIGAFIEAHPLRSVQRMHAERTQALGLPAAYRSSAELHAMRGAYIRQLQAFVESYSPPTLLEIGARSEDLARSNFHLAYQGGDDLHAQNLYGDWLAASLAQVSPQPPLSPRTVSARPKIALVSSKWYECTGGWYFASWVEHLCRSWDVALVHTHGARRDALTQRLAERCGVEVSLAQSMNAAAAQIRALNADIVLYPELGADGFTFGLAAQRLAPLQLCAWGQPVTSGLPTIDAFLSCDVMEPPGAAAHYRERLVTLPGIGTRYLSPPLPPERAARNPR